MKESIMRQVYLACLSLLIFFPIVLSAQENVLVYGEAFSNSAVLKKDLENKNFKVQYITAAGLSDITVDQGRLLLMGGDTPCPPESRQAISKYLAKGGNVMMVGPALFDYTPKPIRPVPVVDFSSSKNYKILKPLRKPRLGSMEKPVIQVVDVPSSKDKGLSFSTKERGMADTYVQFAVAQHASSTKSVLTFNAKGNHYMDLLALEIKDKDKNRWLTFVPLSLEWKEYTVSLADFLPEGWKSEGTMYPLLEPAQVDSLAIGANLATVWKEKPMAFGIANVALCENATGIYTPTSALNALRLPFLENGITVPQWIVDPFFQSQPEGSTETLVSPQDSPFAAVSPVTVKDKVLLADALVEFPGSMSGTDTKKSYDYRLDREKRAIPLLVTNGGNVVARFDIHAGGKYRHAAVAAFGLQPETMLAHADLRRTLTDAIDFILRTPRVLKTTVNTTTQKADEEIVPKFKILLQNPTSQTVKGKLTLAIEGLSQKKVDVTISPRETLDRIVQFGEVPADFSFKKFDWKIELTTPLGNDRVQETVDVERAMLEAFIHLVETQKKYPDGRYSNHYFGDAYGVRAMFAYLDFLDRNPEHLAKNTDLWKKISPADIRESAIRFCDMLVERQLPDGALPMGYSEHAHGYNVADGGQMVLALSQLSRYVKDEQKRKTYMNVVYRFMDWAETYYIDKAKSDSLKTSEPDAYKKGQAKEGLYGLGRSGKRRRETGPSWVLSDILGAQVYVAYVDKNDRQQMYREIAERNVRFYANAQYSAAGYYQAEALFWSYLTTQDKSIRKVIAANLKNSFLPPLYKGKLNDMYDLGSRSTLRALPLLYYQQFIANTASNRAVLLKYIWSFGSDDSMSSMHNLAQSFPKPVHGESLAAAKYAALSALWAMELLEPGSTLYPGVN
ncbi:hypothetical protein G5B30_14140 [Sphingobacterium sp. SGG-5]|uniref:hypothetical protein n=1 Tax=Sphingobacterium sp. SGG-5 TaxID=2710881 RepID=UPI0013EE202C|nr:hypothetical protein [Sphingobacterium sp. SGG-5]NGM63048.1 hypothetical protein [Sphingobacterium sp. SGG-5]